MNPEFLQIAFKRFELTPSIEECAQITSLFQEKSYKKGDLVLEAGDKYPMMAFIKKGMTKFSINTITGKEYISALFVDNDFFMNFMGVMTEDENPFFIETLEECQIYVANFFKVDEALQGKLFWHKIKQKFYEHYFIVKVKREIALLSVDATTRYLNLKIERPDLVSRVSQQNLALYLGINPVSLNRIIKSLEKEKL